MRGVLVGASHRKALQSVVDYDTSRHLCQLLQQWTWRITCVLYCSFTMRVSMYHNVPLQAKFEKKLGD